MHVLPGEVCLVCHAGVLEHFTDERMIEINGRHVKVVLEGVECNFCGETVYDESSLQLLASLDSVTGEKSK